VGVLAGGEFRERDYKECNPVGKKWLEELLAQRGMEAHTLAGEAFKDGDVEFYPASGKRETADAEVRKDGYIWAKRADGHPVFHFYTFSIWDRRKDSKAVIQVSFSHDGLNAYAALTGDIERGEFWLGDTTRGEDSKYNLPPSLVLVLHRESLYHPWGLCSGACWKDRACEGEVPNPSLYSLLGILNFPLEAL